MRRRFALVRILQAHTRYRQAGGEDAVVAAEAKLLRSGGHEVARLEARNPAGAAAAAGAMATAAWNAAAARRMTDRIAEFAPDVVHVHNTWFAMSPSVVQAARRKGVPVVLTLHNYRLMCSNGLLFRDGRPCTDCVDSHPWHGVVHRCYRGSATASVVAATNIAVNRSRGTWRNCVDAYIAMTEAARPLFVAAGLPSDRIVVKPHFVSDPGSRRQAPSASRTVLYVGRLEVGKGIEVLLRAWRQLGDTDLELLVIGDGPLRASLEQLAPAGVRFSGWLPREQVREHLLTARAFAFPSEWYEPFGLVVVEAMAAGLAVTGSRIGGVDELLGTSGADQLVPPGDAEALASSLERLREDGMADRVGALMRRRYEERFTPAANLPLLEGIYASVQSGAGLSAR